MSFIISTTNSTVSGAVSSPPTTSTNGTIWGGANQCAFAVKGLLLSGTIS